MQEKEFLRRISHGNFGIIEVVCGPMFSGKTEELIRRLKRAQIACQKVMVFKSKIDDRYHAEKVVSHSKQSFFSKAVENSAQIEEFFKEARCEFNVVGIDEAQFFDHDIIKVVEKLAAKNIRVITAGLDQDYLSRPFGPMGELLAIADMVTKQCAVCVACGAPATKTQKVKHKSPKNNPEKKTQVLVGTVDTYEARCRPCYVKDLDKPKARSYEQNPQIHSPEALV